MKDFLAIRCSPRPGGVSDRLAEYFAEGLAESGGAARVISLRDYDFHPCDGCGRCAAFPHACRFQDQFNILYDYLAGAALAVVSAPVYFYALPAICAAFINRGQALWQNNNSNKKIAPGIAIFAAGRSRGARLFTGSSLSFFYFFKAGGSRLLARYGFKGMENPDSLEKKPSIRRFLFDKGKAWARYAALNA